jgi:hypothetical protein
MHLNTLTPRANQPATLHEIEMLGNIGLRKAETTPYVLHVAIPDFRQAIGDLKPDWMSQDLEDVRFPFEVQLFHLEHLLFFVHHLPSSAYVLILANDRVLCTIGILIKSVIFLYND